MRVILHLVFGLVGSFRRALLLILLMASLALNIATVTSTAVFTAVSGAVGAVSGVSTVMAKQSAKRQAQKQAIRRTRGAISRRVARAAARNMASSAAEAIPLAGAAVVAAALVWDIRDACATARDLALLEVQFEDPTVLSPDLNFSCFDLVKGRESETLLEASSDPAPPSPNVTNN